MDEQNKEMEELEFRKSLEDFCGDMEQKHSTIRPAVGYYGTIRSSEEKNAMICWNKPEYDDTCGRWFESSGAHFACWRDAQAFQEADDMDMWEFHSEHPDICVRESFCEIEYGKVNGIIKNAHYLLIDYRGEKHRSFSFEISHVSKEELAEWEAAVMKWHATGEIKTAHFFCDSMHWAWKNN